MTDYQRQLDALRDNAPPAASPAAPSSAPPPRMPPPSPLSRPAGRRYGFLCSYCSSRLEATENMAGQSGTCPTCGNTIVIPILDHRGRLIDPTSGQIIKQDPHPVHAYAAAGHRAPQIITEEPTGEKKIRCPRCARDNPINANNCLGCGLPFTMDGTVGDAISGTNTWAVASLVLGIVTMVGGLCFVVPQVLAVVFGVVALRGASQSSSPPTGQGLAIAGIVMGVIGMLIFGVIALAYVH